MRADALCVWTIVARIANEPTSMSSLPLRILILEPHTVQRAIAVNLIRQIGNIEVLAVAQGREALTVLAQTGAVDIAVFDVRMDDMDGLAFLRQAAQEGWINALVLHGAHPPELLRSIKQFVALLGLRVLGYIDKPDWLSQLNRVVHQYHHPCAFVHEARGRVPLVSEMEVRAALVAGQFRAYYQPKFDLKTFKMCGAEVLARWEHPQKGVLSPASFMPVLEQCGLLDDLLLMQMRQGLMLQRRMRSFGVALKLAFNLHASQLDSSTLSFKIMELLIHFQAPRFSVTLELTESGIFQASADSLECLLRLRMMGCNLSIDDFGAGFSSLQRLCELPFNEIKLDATFTCAAKEDPRSRRIISSIQAMGESLGMTVVIEGIETQEQYHLLRGLGCLIGQGYFFARPMSEGQLLCWLATI